MTEQRFKRVMNTLLREIFQNKLKPGDKLPTERALSKEMGVDRTSLRVALKQLESMEVLEIRQGDGIYVNNYLKKAGVDFLRMLFLQQEEEEDEIIIDEYIIDEVLNFWLEFMPLMLRVALKRMTARDVKHFIEIINEELASIHDRKKIIELQVHQMEIIAERTDNLLFLLISNSTRPLRKKMVELFISNIDDNTLKKHIELKRALFRVNVTGKLENPDEVVTIYKQVLATYHEIIRKSWRGSSRDRKIIEDFIATAKDRVA